MGNTHILSELQEQLKKYQTLYKHTIKHSPDSVRLYNNLGTAYNEAGKHQAAIEVLEKAIEIKPDYADTYYNLARAYNFIGKSNQAIKAY